MRSPEMASPEGFNIRIGIDEPVEGSSSASIWLETSMELVCTKLVSPTYPATRAKDFARMRCPFTGLESLNLNDSSTAWD